MTNCPNCGAVITGPICEYCDTRFPWFDEYEKVKFLRLETEALKHMVRHKFDVCRMQNIYLEALRAMRRYDSQ